ncbi:MAG TPA: translocation/assembly module TamB domain-containing protein [Methylophilaceae bacterium]|nr:translocation/assembly module TamB domain-containing protein [Methylophilaceae bacterium]
MASNRLRWWRWVIAAVLGLLVLLIVSLWVAVKTEVGARTVWHLATSLDSRLSGVYRGGTLSNGLRLGDVGFHDALHQITVNHVSADWQIALSPLRLTVHRLALGEVQATVLPGPDEPTKLPVTLRLPLAIDLQQANIEKLVVSNGVVSQTFSNIALSAHSDGLNHRLQLHRAETPFGHATLQLTLNGDRPFRLSGQAALEGEARQQPYALTASFSGSLEKLKLAANVTAARTKTQASADLVLTPFAAIPFTNARINAAGLNLADFAPDLPKTAFDIHADLAPVSTQPVPDDLAKLQVAGPIRLLNHLPGAIDEHRVPVVSLSAQARLDAESQQLSALTIRLPGGGELTGSATNRSPLKGRLALQAHHLNLAALHTALQPTQLDGPLTLTFQPQEQQVKLDLAGSSYSIRAHAALDAKSIVVESAELQSGPAQLTLQGQLARDASMAYSVKGTLSDFNPGRFIKTMKIQAPQPQQDLPFKIYEADINGSFQVQGQIHPELTAAATFGIHDSSYNGLPMAGSGKLQFAGKRVLDSNARLAVAGNEFTVKGAFGRPSDRLLLDVDAPALDRLGFGLGGALKLNGSFTGTLEQPQVAADFSARNLKFAAHRLARGTGHISLQGLPKQGSDATLKVNLTAQGYRGELGRIDHLQAEADGSYGQHSLQLDTDGELRGQKLDLSLRAQGNLHSVNDALTWSGTVSRLENRTFPQIHLANAARLEVAPQLFRLGATEISIAGTWLNIDSVAYEAGAISSKGQANALDVAHLLKLRQEFTGEAPPVQTNLILDANWDFRLGRQAQGYVQVQRKSGDISSPAKTGDILLGLSQLQLRGDFAGEQLNIHTAVEASRIGRLAGEGHIGLLQQDGMLTLSQDSPVNGTLHLEVPQLRQVGAFAGPRISLNGRFEGTLDVDGTLGNMEVSGLIQGRELALTLYDQGVKLSNGTARIRLHDNVLEMQQVEFHGGKGTLRITGSLPLNAELATRPDLTAHIIADKLQLLADPASQLTLSGNAEIANTGEHYTVDGKFTVDSALFDLPEQAAPQLSNDVVVIRGGDALPAADKKPAEPPASRFSPAIHLDINLGRDFRFQGRGADLRLAGQITLLREPGHEPRVQGTVRVAEGTFEAFGTTLAIERGIINFQGPMDNPNINILAMRRKQEVAAGVQVTGTANNPRVTLVSEPDVPEDQKLSWLVFGHAGGGEAQGQAQAAARGAAQALVNKMVEGTNVAKNLGLSEISFSTGSAGQQLVTLGKTLTDKLSLGYRQGITSAESAVELTYQLSRHWSAVARGGQVLGFNLLYSRRFDSVREPRRKYRTESNPR